MPTLAGFMVWALAVMGIPTASLPNNSPYWAYAFNVAKALANQSFTNIPVGTDGTTIYTLMVYNLAGSNLINWALDPTPPLMPPNNPTYWSDLRDNFGTNKFVAGLVASASDQGTSDALTTQEYMKTITLANLQQLKDPYGRTYLQFAQTYGTVWGIN